MNYYSQHGEDRWISQNLKLPEDGVFVEVGAFDGILSSNTLHFEERGWTGLLIEPDREMAAKCLLNRRCHVACCAVGSNTGQRNFFVNHEDKGLSGLERAGIPTPTVVAKLYQVLETYSIRYVNLLSIDTEGTELDVWNSLIAWRHILPDVLIMEYSTLGLPPKDGEIIPAIRGCDYELVHRTDCNLIFVR